MHPAQDTFQVHLTGDMLEAYAMGKTPEADLAGIEEHMLICERCRERLSATEVFLAALRDALEASDRAPIRVRSASGGEA